MATYKVISLSVGGLNNKIYRFGEEVTEKAFGEKRIQYLIDGKYIELLEEIETEVEIKPKKK
jgi:hypothetical protein